MPPAWYGETNRRGVMGTGMPRRKRVMTERPSTASAVAPGKLGPTPNPLAHHQRSHNSGQGGLRPAPEHRQHLVRRARLLKWAPDEAGAWATLLTAPAGYGKTIGIRALAEQSAARGVELVWVNAGAARSETLEISAVRALGNGAAVPGTLESFVDGLGERRICLILDELDSWSDGPSFICKLAVLRAQGLTLLGARREPTGEGLARLQVNGELREIGVSELRFTDEETASFFGAAGLSLDPAVRNEVQQVTQGWPAALRLSVPLLQQNPQRRTGLAQALASPNGLLGAYLKDELLNRIPADRRSYLLEAGALGRFTAGLLEEAIGCRDGATMIRRLDEAAFFVTPEEQDGRWRRFHPLVCAFLEATLRAESPSRSRQVHSRAAAWHESQGQLGEAIAHAFASQDIDTAVRLLEQASSVRERIGRWRIFTEWTARLGDHLLNAHPGLRIEAACAHSVLFEFDAARAHLDSVQANHRSLSADMADELLAAEAIYATFSDDPERALRVCEDGLRRLHGANLYALGCLHLASGVGKIARGQMAEAHVSLQVARATYENGQSRFGAAMALALLGLTYASEGRLEPALAAWREGELMVHLLPMASATESIAVGYAPLVLYEQDRLDAVDAYLARCFARTAEILLPDMVTALYVAAARTAFARDDHDRANSYLEEAENAGLRRKWPRLVLAAGAERVRLALRRDDWNEAMRLKKAMDARRASLPAGPEGMDLEGPGLLDWRIKAFKEVNRSLISELHGAAAHAVAEKRIWRAVRLMVLEAVARDRMGARSGALRTMARAIGLGAPGGFVRVFLDEGRVSVDLVRELAEQEARAPSTPPIEYRNILAAARIAMPAKRDADEPRETLSPREIDVLRMVAAGLSNRELARRLAVSENTVKWHLQRVFSKLGAENRTRAALIARRRGLIA